MKSERRHELQHNTLDTELTAIAGFLRNQWQKLLLGLAIIALVGVAINFYVSGRSTELANIESQYADVKARLRPYDAEERDSVIGKLKVLAIQTRVPRIAALACIDIANVHAAAGEDDHLAQAAEYYNRVITDFADNKTAVAKAHLGLARLAESAGKFDEAREHYQAVKDAPGQPVTALAEAGSAGLTALGAKVRLASTRPATLTSKPSGPSEPTSVPSPKPE